MADAALDVHMAEDEVPRFRSISDIAIVDSLEKLGFPEERVRVKSGIALLSLLKQKLDSEDVGSCTEISYTLKRLIRGVSSTFVDKKAGHFAVLVELLSRFHRIKVEDVLDIVNEELQPGKRCTGKENREMNGGQVFVIGALIRSKKILSSPCELQVIIIDKLINAGLKKKIFIPCVCSFLVEYMDQIDADVFESAIWCKLKPLLPESWEKQNVDTLYLISKASKKFSKVVKKTYNNNIILKNEGFIQESSMPHIIRLLMDAPVILYNHPFYELITQEIATSPLLVDFWKAAVREVEKNPSVTKEKALIKMCSRLVDLADRKKIPCLFCAGFMNVIGKLFRYMHLKSENGNDIKDLFKKITAVLNGISGDEDRRKLKVSFIKCFIVYPGNLMNPQKTGDVIRELYSSKEEKGILTIGKVLRQIICNEVPKVENEKGETCPWNNRERMSAVWVFTGILNVPAMREKVKWKTEQILFLVSQGFFFTAGSASPPNLVVADKLRDCFFKIMNPKFYGFGQLTTLLLSVVDHINDTMFKDGNSSKLFLPLSERSQAAWRKMFSVVKDLQSREGNGSAANEIERKLFIVLLLYMGLYLLKDATLAEDILQELHCCYERNKKESAISKKKNVVLKGKVTNIEEPHWTEVMVDLFISLLSQNSRSLRSLVVVVFPYFCPYLNAASMRPILQVLDPHSKQSFFQEDSEGEESSGSDDEKSEENHLHDSGNGENCNNDLDDNIVPGNEDEDDDEEEDDDIEEDLCEPVDAELKLAVQNALKNAGGDEKDSDEDSVDMDKMSKEDRIKLDTALSNAFKLLKPNKGNKKKKMSKDEEMLMHFRVRVLDMVEVFITNKPDLTLLLDIMQLLFDLLEYCSKDQHQTPLQHRIITILRKLSGLKDFSNVLGVNSGMLGEKLKKLLKKEERTDIVQRNIATSLSQCCTFIARLSLLVNESGLSDSRKDCVLEVFREALISFFTQRDSLIPLNVFTSVLSLAWDGAWILADDILNYIFASNCRPFRRNQAIQLLEEIISNRRHLDLTENIEKLQKLGRGLIKKSEQLLAHDTSGNNQITETNVKDFITLLYTLFETDKLCQMKGFSSLDWTDVEKNILLYLQSPRKTAGVEKFLENFASALQVNLDEAFSKARKECESRPETQSVGRKLKHQRSMIETDADNYQDRSSVESSEGDKGYVSDNPDNTEENRKRKRPKANNQKGKAVLKKMSKIARLETMSSGLDCELRFSEVNSFHGDNTEENKDDSSGKQKKKSILHKKNFQRNVNKTSPPPQHHNKLQNKVKQGKSREFRRKKQKISE